MEASLTCAVCLGVFREPVTLPRCSHNFCKTCVQECATPQTLTVVQSRSGEYCTVCCPLCRKVSSLSGGLSALPVNTTLAEIVRLLPLPGRAIGGRSAGATGGEAGPVCADSGKTSCAEHPEYRLELFCKNCEQACCGKCVSLRHQGIFHNVNLLDMVYQEEKAILKTNEDAVTSAFGEVQKALDLKKQKLLDLVKQQQSASLKRSKVRKVTKAHHKTTIETLLKDCENIVDNYEPRSFLQVACGLNKRMKSNLELMGFCSDRNEDVLKIELQSVDVQTLLDAVAALTLTSGSNDVSKQSGSFSFKSMSRTWNDGMTTDEKYCPVQDQEMIYLQGQMQKMSIRFVCITKMPEYQHLSYEELRLKYYEPSVVQEREVASPSERQRPLICNNVNGVTFRIPLLNTVKPTKLKRQDAFDWERTVYGEKIVFKEKSTKKDFGREEQKNSCCASAAIKAPHFPRSPIGDLDLSSPISNTSLFSTFCMGKSETATIKKSGWNDKTVKKMKPTPCFPKFLSPGSVASTSATADTSSYTFSSAVGNAEEDMSVSSAFSEEFYDVNCIMDPHVEEPCALRSSSHNSTDSDESSLQRSPL
ncbi:uncharacterized protein [Dendropsophus ebraccatus]|uniref:uncharacterized protein isoform X2 n=1 Tax=Dendropsophus ebraccatus TaxID=150705 RepID=UPI003831C12F